MKNICLLILFSIFNFPLIARRVLIDFYLHIFGNCWVLGVDLRGSVICVTRMDIILKGVID